jgi:glycerol-3-phosphate acyltransferase PlsY
MQAFIPWILLAYAVGTIPFGLIIARARGIDIRRHGSGNIGATNVGRVLGRRVGAACFVLDLAKGLVPTLAAGVATGSAGRLDLPSAQAGGWVCVAAAAVLGHVFPVWLRFKGGKGVATGLGAILAVYPVLTAAAAGAVLVWLATAAISRYVSLSSCVAALSLPVFAALIGAAASYRRGEAVTIEPAYLVATGALAALVLWTHRANIARLRAGTEFRIGQARPSSPVPPADAR